MKRLILLLGLLYATSGLAQEDGDQLFSADILHEIRINAPNPAFFDNLVQDFNNNILGTIPYSAASVSIDGQQLDSVGVRIKGGLSAFEEKKPLKLDFNRFIDGQTYDGLRKVNLHNAYFDQSMQREAMSYEILRRSGLKASRTAFAQVFINDEFHGVYLIVEQIDKKFLSNYFADDSGVLYKTGETGLEVKTEGATLEAYDQLINTVNTFSGDALRDTLDKILDTEALLRNIATQNLINATDNLIDVSYNYYLYQEPKSGLFYFIPWDFNLAFFPFANYDIDFTPVNIVAQKVFEIAAYQERYRQIYCQLLDYNFIETDLVQLLESREALIRDAVATDPRIPFNIEDFDAEQIIVKEWIANRIEQLENQLADLDIDCIPLESIPPMAVSINEIMASSDSTGGIADPAGGYPDWIELYNNTGEAISLEGYYLSDDKDFRKHWAFPAGTIIPANDYLIIWADRDLDETGLHTNFKLKKSQGDLFLIYEDFTIIDSLSYGPQEKNIALARVPNGTGSFINQAATFNESNVPLSVNEQSKNSFAWRVFPNPTNKQIQVSTTEAFSGLSLIDQYGRILKRSEGIILNVEDVAAGIYWVRIESTEGLHFLKKIIIH